MSKLKSTRLVLVTNAAGNIGKYFAERANKQKHIRKYFHLIFCSIVVYIICS
jgi:hypothetical protein